VGKTRESRRGGEGRGGERCRERERVKRCHAGRERRERYCTLVCTKLSKACKTKPLVTYKFCFASKKPYHLVSLLHCGLAIYIINMYLKAKR
jgi:hypothetical protein